MRKILKEEIYAEIERLSGNKKEVYERWKKENYLADGEIVSKFWDLIEKAKNILILGDYDVDGICATYIMATSIKSVYADKNVRVRVPKRFSEGYGIGENIVQGIINNYPKGTLIITVDNGITAADKLEYLESQGYIVALTDHHSLVKGRIPNVSFVLDPSVSNEDGEKNACGGDYWCGAGVAYKLVEQYLTEEMKLNAEIFAGIATISDCMPLIEGNWQIVRNTIKNIRKRKCPPQIITLLSALNKDYRYCNEDTIGYYLGPAINAPGRLYDNGGSIVLKYLFSPTATGAMELVNINNNRKELRDEQYAYIKSIIEENNLENKCPIWIEAKGLHEGIVGILAGRVVEDYGVPAIILTEQENGLLKGSARSIDGIHILDLLNNCGANFIKLGGHAGAAGMTISKSEFDIAKEYQTEKIEDGKIQKREIQIELFEIPEICEELKKMEPFGEKNPTPNFYTYIDINSDNAKMLGAGNEHLIVTDSEGEWKATHFYHSPNNLENKEKFYLVGTISYEGFNNKGMATLNGISVFDSMEVKGDFEKLQYTW